MSAIVPQRLPSLSAASRARPSAAGGARIVVSFRNDDPSATSDVEHERRIAACFERYGFAQTIGVIPWSPGRTHRDPHARLAVPLEANAEMVAFLREYVARSGSEIALHGYTHRTLACSRPWRREYFEFRRLGFAEALRRLRAGLDHLESVLGVRPRTFIPPWNRLDRDTLRACVAAGIELVSAAEHTPTVAGLLGYGANCGLQELPARLAALRAGAGRGFLNVLYHSPTTVRPRELEVLERALEAVARCPQCEVLTLIEAARRYRPEIEQVNAAARNVCAQDELHGSVRAQVVIYRKLPRALRRPSRLERLYAELQRRFQEGRYREVLAQETAIERGCRRLLYAFRAVAAAGGMALGGIFGFVALQAASMRSWVLFAPPLALLGIGAAAAWWATAPDSKREAFVFFASAAAGTLAATALVWVTAGGGLGR